MRFILYNSIFINEDIHLLQTSSMLLHMGLRGLEGSDGNSCSEGGEGGCDYGK